LWGVFKMNLKSALASGVAISALCLALPSQAGTYVSVFGGLSSIDGDDITVGPFQTSTTSTRKTSDTDFWDVGFVDILGNYTIMFWDGGQASTATTLHYTTSTTVGAFRESNIDSGFVVGAALGFASVDGWRMELEGAWRQADINGRHSLSGQRVVGGYADRAYNIWGSGNNGTLIFLTTYTQFPTFSQYSKIGYYTSGNPFTFSTAAPFSSAVSNFAGSARGTGEVTSFSIMANLWYDFDLGNQSPIVPFIGGGIGLAQVGVEYDGRIALPSTTIAFSTDEDDWTFAWQLGAGLGYEFGNGMMISAQYRYFATGDITIAGEDFGLSAHEGLIGLNIPLGH